MDTDSKSVTSNPSLDRLKVLKAYERLKRPDPSRIKKNENKNQSSNTSLDRLEVLKAYERLKYPDPWRIKKISDKNKWSKCRTLNALEECRRLKQFQLNVKTNKINLKINNQPKHIQFLNECVYEHLQRMQYHQGYFITEEVIIQSALKFYDILKMNDFKPNKKWLTFFKVTYNISLSNKKIILTRVPPSSLDVNEIINYCKSQEQTSYEIPTINGLELLEIALEEYIKRVQLYNKDLKIVVSNLIQVALNLKEILNLKDFKPTKNWLKNFSKRNISLEKCKSSSLNLLDILYYCSKGQMGKKCMKSSLTSDGNLTIINEKFKKDQNAFKSPLEANNKELLTNINETISTQTMHSDYNNEQHLLDTNMLQQEIDIKPYLEEFFIQQQPNDDNKTKQANCPKEEVDLKVASSQGMHSEAINEQQLPYINILQEEIDIKDIFDTPESLTSTNADQQNISDPEDESEELLYLGSNDEALSMIKSLEVYYGHNDRAIGLFAQLEDAFRNHQKNDDDEMKE